MSNTQQKILESLSGLVPVEAQEKVSSAVSSILNDLNSEYEDAYNAKLQETCDKLVEENEQNIEKAKASYTEAYEVISDLRGRLELQREEFDAAMNEEYEEAYKMILAERKKTEELEGRLYEEYDAKLKDIKAYMVDKIDEFLSTQGEKFYEMAKTEVLNDPCMAEHRVAFDKIVEVVGNYVSDDDLMFNTNSKVSELHEKIEKEAKEKRLLEAKIMKLESDKNKLNEVAYEAQKLLQEQMVNEEKEWVNRGRNAEGRGEVVNESRKVVIGEKTSKEPESKMEKSNHTSSRNTLMKEWQTLAGMNGDTE